MNNDKLVVGDLLTDTEILDALDDALERWRVRSEYNAIDAQIGDLSFVMRKKDETSAREALSDAITKQIAARVTMKLEGQEVIMPAWWEKKMKRPT